MPYIKVGDRLSLSLSPNPHTPGELNYILTKTCLKYLSTNPQYIPTYDDYNAIMGVLECCKLEFYRRAVATYEDKKIIENGDVY